MLLGLQCATFIHPTEQVLPLTLFESNMNFPVYPAADVSTNKQTKTPKGKVHLQKLLSP